LEASNNLKPKEMNRIILTCIGISFFLVGGSPKASVGRIALHADRKVKALLVSMETFDVDAYKRLGYKYNYNNRATAGVRTDVKNIRTILLRSGVKTDDIVELDTKKATAQRVFHTMDSLATLLDSSDVFLFYFTGHGDSIPNLDPNEKEKYDQVFIAYDNRLIDDQFKVHFTEKFKRGTNVIMIMDACHSGSGFELSSNCDINAEVNKSYPVNIIYMSAASDNAEAAGSSTGSLFTSSIYRVYDELEEDGDLKKYDYPKFLDKVQSKMTCFYRIQYKELGKPDSLLLNSQPFKLR
jgi:metacaspase-1